MNRELTVGVMRRCYTGENKRTKENESIQKSSSTRNNVQQEKKDWQIVSSILSGYSQLGGIF